MKSATQKQRNFCHKYQLFVKLHTEEIKKKNHVCWRFNGARDKWFLRQNTASKLAISVSDSYSGHTKSDQS